MAKKRQVSLTLSDFTENFLYLGNEPFSLEDYPHMRQIYNSNAKDIVMKFSRQCVVDDQPIDLWNGKRRKAKELQKGDLLVTLDEESLTNKLRPIKALWDNGVQECYLIQTQNGHKARVTFNHPFYTQRGWVEAQNLKKDDLIATSLNNSCVLEETKKKISTNLNDIKAKAKEYDREDPVWEEIFYYDLKQLQALFKTLFKYEGFIHLYDLTAKITLWSMEWIKAIEAILLKYKVKSEIYIEPTKAITLDAINAKRFIYTFIKKAGHENFEPTYEEIKEDFYFDPIEKIKNIGSKSTTSIEVEGTHTFYIDHLATHNTAKSTTLANMIMSRAIMHSDSGQLYVSPAVAQTQEFSRSKLEPVIMNSPLIRNNYVDPKLVQNVHKKRFTNHSRIDLRYALLSGDRIRGISSDYNYYDECQDLLKDVITVIAETMTRSEVKKSVYAGTPKRTKGTLADLWFKSTQHEYAVKSSASGYWNILGPDNIGLNGLIDKKSGEPLDLRKDKGEWVSTYTHQKDRPLMEGYRVCLLHFAHSPWVDWDKDVIYKRENTSTALFYNETLGLEYDAGAIPITKEEVIRACNSEVRMTGEPQRKDRGKLSIMGIDYGPVNSDNSHTCISIIQEKGNKMQVVYAKKFLGKEADYAYIHKEIPRLMSKWNCRVLAADYGMGEAPNSEFRNRLGPEKVLAFQHIHTQKDIFKYNNKMRAFTLNRNYVLTKFFEMLKKGHLRLPHWEDFGEISQDIRNILIEYDEVKNTQKFVNVGPDDFVHATIYGVMALMSLSANNLNKYLI